MPAQWAKYILCKILASDFFAGKGFLSTDSEKIAGWFNFVAPRFCEDQLFACASVNHRSHESRAPSHLIPRKLAANLQLLIADFVYGHILCGSICNCNLKIISVHKIPNEFFLVSGSGNYHKLLNSVLLTLNLKTSANLQLIFRLNIVNVRANEECYHSLEINSFLACFYWWNVCKLFLTFIATAQTLLAAYNVALYSRRHWCAACDGVVLNLVSDADHSRENECTMLCSIGLLIDEQ